MTGKPEACPSRRPLAQNPQAQFWNTSPAVEIGTFLWRVRTKPHCHAAATLLIQLAFFLRIGGTLKVYSITIGIGERHYP